MILSIRTPKLHAQEQVPTAVTGHAEQAPVAAVNNSSRPAQINPQPHLPFAEFRRGVTLGSGALRVPYRWQVSLGGGSLSAPATGAVGVGAVDQGAFSLSIANMRRHFTGSLQLLAAPGALFTDTTVRALPVNVVLRDIGRQRGGVWFANVVLSPQVSHQMWANYSGDVTSVLNNVQITAELMAEILRAAGARSLVGRNAFTFISIRTTVQAGVRAIAGTGQTVQTTPTVPVQLEARVLFSLLPMVAIDVGVQAMRDLMRDDASTNPLGLHDARARVGFTVGGPTSPNLSLGVQVRQTQLDAGAQREEAPNTPQSGSPTTNGVQPVTYVGGDLTLRL